MNWYLISGENGFLYRFNVLKNGIILNVYFSTI